MLEELDSYDWEEAFKYAEGPTPVPPGVAVYDASVTRDDVAKIVAIAEGENDGESWLGVFHLHDGRWFALRAWCDYTGWG